MRQRSRQLVDGLNDPLCNGSQRSDITPVIDSMADAVCRLYPETRYMPATLITRTLFFLAHHVPDFLIDMAIAQFPAIKCHT